MRPIDADALIAEMHNTTLEDGEDRSIFYGVIERQPTIDAVEVVRGEWIGYNADKGIDWLRSDGEPIFLVCNKCHGIVMNNASVNWNFCPNCGAKMGTACTHVEEGE